MDIASGGTAVYHNDIATEHTLAALPEMRRRIFDVVNGLEITLVGTYEPDVGRLGKLSVPFRSGDKARGIVIQTCTHFCIVEALLITPCIDGHANVIVVH